MSIFFTGANVLNARAFVLPLKTMRPKINKDHNKQKMLKIGISVGRNDLNFEGHFQVGFHGKTVKITNQLKNQLKTMCRSLLPSLKNKNVPYYHSFHSMSGHGRVLV